MTAQDAEPNDAQADEAATPPSAEASGTLEAGAPEDANGLGADAASVEPSPLAVAVASLTPAIGAVLDAARSDNAAFIRGRMSELRGLLDRLDPASLTPRSGLAGLFDGRRKRLRRFRDLLLDSKPAISTVLVKLRDTGAEMVRRHVTLDERHEVVRAGLDRLDSALAAAPPIDDAALTDERPLSELVERLEHETRSADTSCDPLALRRATLRCLPLTRAIQNADARLADVVAASAEAVGDWRDQALAAFGADGNRMRPLGRLRPDAGALIEARSRLFERLDALERALTAAATRREQAIASIHNDLTRLQGHSGDQG